MATEHFCLRWNNHQSTLVSVFDNLLESGTLVDCTLAADGRYLKAHKVVLSACSPYLGMLLSQHHDKHPIIILKDVKFEELKAMLDYMYRGEVNISQEQLTTFLKAAESLQIKGLTDTGGEEGLQPIRPPSSNSTVSVNNEDAPSPGDGSPSRKRRRNRTVEEMPDCETKLTISESASVTKTSVGVKREPVDTDGDGQSVNLDESSDSGMLSRPGPSNGGSTNNKGSPWLLPGDNSEEMQLTQSQGSNQQSHQQQQYMQNMMQMYGNMWMDGMNPMDMDQEMLAAYNYGRPNWNQNRYICTTCGRTYSLQASLYNHKKFECGKMPNFICPYCPHRTKQKGNLKTHIKKRHPEFFSEPFMPSPSRLNSMMNSIMMQSTMAQNSLLQNSQNTHNRNVPMQNSLQSPSSPMMQNAKSPMQNMSPSSLMQTPSKTQNMNNLLQAMKQQMPQNSSNAMAANLVQALQSLPNSTSISALDIMQALAQGSPKSPMTPQRMSPMSASPAHPNPPQSPMAANQSNNSNFNPPSVPPPNINGSVKSEAPKSPEMPSEMPKSPAISSFTSLSLEVADSEDSSDTSILPSYPVSE